MKELMTDIEKNRMYKIDVVLEKFYFDDDDAEGSYDESSDTYKLLVEQLNRMKQKVRGELQLSIDSKLCFGILGLFCIVSRSIDKLTSPFIPFYITPLFFSYNNRWLRPGYYICAKNGQKARDDEWAFRIYHSRVHSGRSE